MLKFCWLKEVGDWKEEVKKFEGRNRKLEVESGKWEVGSEEVRNRKMRK